MKCFTKVQSFSRPTNLFPLLFLPILLFVINEISRETNMWGLIKNECKLIQILVQGRQFGEIAGQEGGAEQFPESAEFFPHGASENWTALRPSVLDGQVNQFLCPGKCPFRPGILACLESLQYAGCLAADVGHLLRERHLGPSAVFKGSVLHLSNNKLFDKPFDGFPDIRIQVESP